jgi:hypothetical protein
MSRATAADQADINGLASEVSRATFAENALTVIGNDETVRAKAAEVLLQNHLVLCDLVRSFRGGRSY